MSTEIWYTSENGEIEIRTLSKEYLQQSLELLQNVFFMEETTAIACGLPDNPEARKEWGDLCLAVANDGVSVIAIDKKEHKVAAVAINKIYRKTNTDELVLYDHFLKSFKSQSAKDLINFCKLVDGVADLFSQCRCNCYLELMFLATSPDYKGKQLATKLAIATLELANELYHGKNVKQSLTDVPLTNEPRPEAVTAVFTSNISQKLIKKLKFEIAASVYYKDVEKNGKSYYELIDKKQEKCQVVYKML